MAEKDKALAKQRSVYKEMRTLRDKYRENEKERSE